MVHGFIQLAFQLGQFALVQLTQEHAELDVIAIAHEGLEYGVPPLIVRNVVRDQITSSHD